VSPRRLRTGELLAGVGAFTAFAALFFDWFDVEAPPAMQRGENLARPVLGRELAGLDTAGWEALGWGMIPPVALALVMAVWLAIATVTDAPVSHAVAAAVLTAAAATIALIATAVRVTFAQPGLGVGLPDELVAVDAPAYLGLGAVALIAAGGWWSLADERTGAPESAYTPPVPRPAPPARA
jgi:hypothetical protein